MTIQEAREKLMQLQAKMSAYNHALALLSYDGATTAPKGTAANRGLVVDEPDRRFEKLYEKYLFGSYNKYSHEDTEIIIEVTPRFVEVWDTCEDNYAFQIFIDFEKQSVEVKPYDKK